MINSLEFDTVYVLDPHSNVGVGLLDRCVQSDVAEYKCCHGMKNRDRGTGRILGLDIVTSGLDISGKRVKEAFAYATHTENSVLDEEKGPF